MVTKGVNLNKIWSTNYLYDHFSQRLHIHHTSHCHFTQVLILHCPVSITITFFSKFIILFAAAGYFGQGHPPFFFRLASNAFPDLGRWLGLKKKLKTKYHKKFRNRRPWYPRMTLNVNIYNLDERNAQYVKGLNPGVIDRPGASGPESTFLHRKISRHVCCFPGLHVTLAHARFHLHCYVRLLNQ